MEENELICKVLYVHYPWVLAYFDKVLAVVQNPCDVSKTPRKIAHTKSCTENITFLMLDL